MKLARCVTVDVAIEASNTQTRLYGFAIVRWIKLLLGEGRQQHSQSVQLYRRKDIFEQPVIVVDRHDLAPRNIAQLRTVAQEDCGRKFRQERVGDVELYIEALQPREHVDLHLREDLAPVDLQWMRQRGIWENAALFDRIRAQFSQLRPRDA